MGKLLVLDGLDGSGKATQTQKLEENLTNLGYKVLHISFPNYEDNSSALVKMYLNGEFGNNPSDVSAYACSSFYAVDRYASFKKFWEKQYNDGYIILCDRYVSSNAIYQMTKLPKNEWDNYLQWTDDYEFNKLGLPRANGIIYLDMPPEISQKLMSKRYKGDESKKDIHESHVEFLQQCRQTAKYSAEKGKWNVISCAENGEPKSIEKIEQEVLNIAISIIK